MENDKKILDRERLQFNTGDTGSRSCTQIGAGHINRDRRNFRFTPGISNSAIIQTKFTLRLAMKKCLTYLLAVVSWFIMGTVWAYDFRPRDQEFYAWPVYCKVVYTRVGVDRYKWAPRISQSDIIRANTMLGEGTYGSGGVHHHCAGTIWLNRARTESNPTQRAFALAQALGETRYTFDRIKPHDPLYSTSHVQMATVAYEQGNLETAVQLLTNLIALKPSPMAYSAKAYVLDKLGETEKAVDLLIEGDQQANGNSSDIQYNLGLMLLKLDKPEEAYEYAKKAYANGYPLPGLRNKLRKAGVWK